MKNIFRVCFLCFILFGFSGCKQIVETTPTTTGYLIIWKGSFETAPSEPEAGWAYYNTTTKKSYIFDGDSWQVLAQDGEDGKDGVSSINEEEASTKSGYLITWKGSLETTPFEPEAGWAYYNTTTKKSYIFDGNAWQILAQDGEDGKDGVSSINEEEVSTKFGYLITWKGSLETAPSEPEAGWAYYNITTKKSYVFDGVYWQILAQDGADGVSSVNEETTTTDSGYLIIWKGSLEITPSEPEAGWAYYNTEDKKSYIYDGSSWQILAQDGEDGADAPLDDETSNSKDNSFVFMGESFEEIDGIAYNVKSYASVYALEPYFYTYYKYYYLNNKLRRACVIYHNHGADLDYTYLEFVEHRCNYCSSYIYIYNENGKLVENIQQPSDSSGKNYEYKTVISYDSYGNKYSEKWYSKNEVLTTERIFDSNGNMRESINYETSVFPSYISSKNTYYEDGKEESHIYYNSLGIETSKNYYTYYNNGIKKTKTTYNNGKISSEESYYSSGKIESEINYNSLGIETSNNSYTYYENGKIESQISYDSMGTEISKFFYTYYETGIVKTKTEYSKSTITQETYYYLNTNIQLQVYYSNGELDDFYYNYPSGYRNIYYYAGYLYSYLDGKTKSSSTYDYESKTPYTLKKAQTKLQELKDQI